MSTKHVEVLLHFRVDEDEMKDTILKTTDELCKVLRVWEQYNVVYAPYVVALTVDGVEYNERV